MTFKYRLCIYKYHMTFSHLCIYKCHHVFNVYLHIICICAYFRSGGCAHARYYATLIFCKKESSCASHTKFYIDFHVATCTASYPGFSHVFQLMPKKNTGRPRSVRGCKSARPHDSQCRFYLRCSLSCKNCRIIFSM